MEEETVTADVVKAAHRLRPEERMLLLIMYVRSLKLDEIVDYIMGTPLPSDRSLIPEYGEIVSLHGELCDKLAQQQSQHQKFEETLEDENEFFYFPPKKRISSQEKRQARVSQVKPTVVLKKRPRKKLSELAKAYDPSASAWSS